MGYTTSVKVVNADGRPVQAEVACGGTTKGYTDPKTGRIDFEMSSPNRYRVSAKKNGKSVAAEINGGKEIVLRLK